MKIGFYTAVFGDQPIDTVARWAADVGFSALEVDVGRHVGDPSGARAVVEAVRGHGLDVCALTTVGTLLDADRAARERTRAAVRATIDASRLGTPLRDGPGAQPGPQLRPLAPDLAGHRLRAGAARRGRPRLPGARQRHGDLCRAAAAGGLLWPGLVDVPAAGARAHRLATLAGLAR